MSRLPESASEAMFERRDLEPGEDVAEGASADEDGEQRHVVTPSAAFALAVTRVFRSHDDAGRTRCLPAGRRRGRYRRGEG
jgi:hypothetical protein